MKKHTNLSLAAIVVLFIVGSGCKKSDTATATPATPVFTSTALSSGSWVVSSFTQRTEDKSSDFAGLDFTFSADSKLVVSGSGNVTGSWSYTAPSAGYYGSSTGSFSIDLGADSPFKRLTRAWNILSQTSSVLKLDATEATEDEHVTFTKK